MYGSALSGIDQALWDLQGKVLGVPVYRLLGAAARAMERGVTAVRYSAVQSADDSGIHDHRAAVNLAVAQTAAIREAVGPEVDLLLECHGRFDPAWAIELARRVETYRPFFIEAPIRHENGASLGTLRAQTAVPLAMGERAHDKWDIREMIEHEHVSYVRPDVCLCGGLTGAKKIAALAEAHHVGVVPHNPLGPVSTAACLQLAACIPNFALQEYPLGEDCPPKSEIVTPVLRRQGGYLLIPDTPGIGIALVPDAATRYPYHPRAVVTRLHADGSVVDQ